MHESAHTARTIFITCTTALMLALGSLLVSSPSAEAGRPAPAKRLTPKEEALIELGRRLFFDPLVSRSGQRSCASCHDPDHGFSDPGRVSDDDFGRTRRHSQTLLDGYRNPSAHWDGEFETVEELVLARVGALKGRKGKLGHGASVFDLVTEAGEADADADAADLDDDGTRDGGDDGTDQDDDTDDGGGGGGGGDDDSYGTPSEPSEAERQSEPGPPTEPNQPGGPAPTARGAEDAPTEGAAPSAPAAPAAGDAPAAPADGAAPPAPAPAPAVKKADDDAAKAKPKEDDEDEADKRLTVEERKAKAELLRAELRKLPQASVVMERGGLYEEAFAAAFGSRSISTARIARAIAAYCRSIESTTSPFDRHRAGEADALSVSAQRGMALFQGRAGCAQCHDTSGKHPALTDFAFHNTGIVWNSLDAKQRLAVMSDEDLFRRKRDDLEKPKRVDGGRARVSTLRRDVRSFKTPTLRDLTRRGPYMHDGRFATLEAVVRYYAAGTCADPCKDGGLHPFKVTDADVADLVAFLESLTGEARPGLPAAAWRQRAEETRLKFVDADGRPLTGLAVRLTPVGDLAADGLADTAPPSEMKTDAKGTITFAAPDRTHTRITLPGAIAPRDGTLVPDTCRKARLVVPVRGRTVVVVRFPAQTAAPKTLVAEHSGVFVLPGHEAPRTRLEQTHVIASPDARVVRYEGWFRTDVPPAVTLRVPGGKAKAVAGVLDPKQPARFDLTAE